jgi:hypothetical protein
MIMHATSLSRPRQDNTNRRPAANEIGFDGFCDKLSAEAKAIEPEEATLNRDGILHFQPADEEDELEDEDDEDEDDEDDDELADDGDEDKEEEEEEEDDLIDDADADDDDDDDDDEDEEDDADDE